MIVINTHELFELLLSEKPSYLIKENEKQIFEFIPELKVCKGFNQNNKWHVYDVYEHILHVIDNTDIMLELRLSALFHDIGKPLVYTEDEKGIGHFYNHWNASNNIFLSFASNNNLDDELTKIASKLIYYHDKKVYKIDNLFEIFNKDEITMLYKLKRADLLSQNSEYHYLLENYNEEEDKILKMCKKYK